MRLSGENSVTPLLPVLTFSSIDAEVCLFFLSSDTWYAEDDCTPQMPVSNSCEAVETCGVHKNQCSDHKQSFRGIALKMHSKTTIADFLRQYYALKNMTKRHALS